MEICFLLFGGRHFYLMCLYDVVSSSVIKYVYRESSVCEEERAVKKVCGSLSFLYSKSPHFLYIWLKLKYQHQHTNNYDILQQKL